MMRHLGRAWLLATAFGWGSVSVLGWPAAGRAAQPHVASPESASSHAPEALHARTRAAIRDVLAQREFADLHTDPNALWRQLSNWIVGFLKRVFAPLQHLPEWALWMIVIWMVLALLAMLAHLIYTLWTSLGATAWTSAGGRSVHAPPGELLGIRDLDFDAVYAEAGRLASAGDWSAATRHLYVAAILWLDRQGHIAFRSSKTNRDYIQELQPATELQGLFRRLTNGFEPIVYGGQNATKSTTDDMARSVEGLFHGPTGALAS
jgi:hypothetical protein